MKRKSTYAWAKYGFIVKEKDKSHDVRRKVEEDDNNNNNRDQSTNVGNIDKENNDINNLSSRKCFNTINDDSNSSLINAFDVMKKANVKTNHHLNHFGIDNDHDHHHKTSSKKKKNSKQHSIMTITPKEFIEMYQFTNYSYFALLLLDDQQSLKPLFTCDIHELMSSIIDKNNILWTITTNMKRLLWIFPDLMKTPITDDDDDDDASNMNNGLKKDVKVVMITNMIPFHCHLPLQQHNTSLTADTSSKVTTKVMTSTDTIMETNNNGTNLFTPQSKTHHSDHSHHHSSHGLNHGHGHRPTTLSKNKSKGPSRLISMSVLKSMLQKAVRRKIVMKAIRLTRYCMKEIHQLQIDADKHHHHHHTHQQHGHHHSQGDERSEEQSSESSASLIDLLRRITIICLEDSLLHPSYPIIIWLMISCSHGYIPHRCLLDICVLFMHDISICNYRDSSITSLYAHSGKTYRSTSSIYDKHFSKTSQAKHWMDISSPTIRTLLVSIAMRGSYGGMTGDMQMIDEFTMLWIKRLVMMPIMMDMNRCGRNEDEKTIHLINRDVSDDMKMVKEDIDGRREDCRRFTSTTCLKHCSFISYLHPVYIEGLMTGGDDRDSFSWNHVLISSFQAPRSIHDRDISSNLNQHNYTTFDSNQQHDMYKSSTTDSYERLLKKTSRMIQSIISLYDTPPQAIEQKSSASSSSSSLSSSSLSSSSSSSTTTTTTDRDDYNLRVDDLVAEGLDHHCDWNILPYVLQSCRQSLRSLVLPITISNNTSTYTNPVTNSTISAVSTISDVSNASMDEVIEGEIKLAIWYFRSAVNPRRYIHLDDMIMTCSIGGRHSNTHGDDHGDDLVHSNPISNEDLHSYIDTTSTRDGILEMMRYELMQKKRLSRLWSIICPHINAYCKEKLNQLSRRLQ